MVAGTVTFVVFFEVRVMQAPRDVVRSPLVVPTHLQVRPPVRTPLRSASDAFQFQGELSMTAGAQVKSDFDGPEDRQLADDIARAMHHRPLMSRLQRVEVLHGNAAGAVAKSATRLAPGPATTPAPAQALPPPLPADPRSLDEVIDDLGHFATTPPSTEWLEKAQREHRRERTRNALAWLTTLGIAGTIVTIAFLLLRI
jgi:hypothetical protein